MDVIRAMRKIVSNMDVELSSKIMYHAFVHKKLNLDLPSTFNEKLCWLKLREFPDNPQVIRCADKYEVYGYIQEKGYGNLLVGLIGVWDKAEDIDWDKLPNKFVLKCTHGCAYNIICTDKGRLNKKQTIKKLNVWLKEDFGMVSGEPHYSKIRRRIICEEFLHGELKDYKFFCFNGIPRFYYVAIIPDGDFHNNLRCDFFWPNGEKTDFYRRDHKRFDILPEKPNNLNEMLKISEDLSSDFLFVRVDLMDVNGKLYFSELTFTPSAGIMPLVPEGTDERLGEWLDLSLYKISGGGV